MPWTIDIAIADTPPKIGDVRALFGEYAKIPGIDICLVDFAREMASLPAPYEFCLLANVDDEAAGAVGLKALARGECEMKRLYVRPRFQGRGLGRALALRLIEEARRRSYDVMRLDTLPHLRAAIGLYRALGFVATEQYYDAAPQGAIFMALDLRVAAAAEI